MCRSLLHHQFSHRDASGKEDIVKPFLQQSAVLRPAAFHHRHILLRKDLLHQLPYCCRSRRRISGGLQDTAVSRRNGPDHGLHAQQKRIIPGRHDQHTAIGLPDGKASPVEIGQVCPPALRPCPLSQMPDLIRQLTQGKPHLTHIGLAGALSQIRPHGITKLPFPGADGLPQFFQRRNPEFHIPGSSAVKILSLLFYDMADFHFCPFLSGFFSQTLSRPPIFRYMTASSLLSINLGTG